MRMDPHETLCSGGAGAELVQFQKRLLRDFQAEPEEPGQPGFHPTFQIPVFQMFKDCCFACSLFPQSKTFRKSRDIFIVFFLIEWFDILFDPEANLREENQKSLLFFNESLKKVIALTDPII